MQICLLKIQETDVPKCFIFTSKCTKKSAWRPGSTWTRWGAYSAPPGSLAGFKG